jgi:hypothetical protein
MKRPVVTGLKAATSQKTVIPKTAFVYLTYDISPVLNVRGDSSVVTGLKDLGSTPDRGRHFSIRHVL